MLPNSTSSDVSTCLPWVSVITEQVVHKRARNQCALGRGPRSAMRAMDLSAMSLSDKLDWVEQARLDAILGDLGLVCLKLHRGQCVRCDR